MANLVSEPESYPWSSYREYLGRRIKPHWLYCQTTLSYFGKRKARYQYKIFINEGNDEEIITFFQKLRMLPVLGSEAFTKTMTEQYLSDRPLSEEVAEHKLLLNQQLLEIQSIIEHVKLYYHITSEYLMLGNNKKGGGRVRDVAIYYCVKLTSKSHYQISDVFKNISCSGISKAINRIKN